MRQSRKKYKYIRKYKNKNGNWIYVYPDGTYKSLGRSYTITGKRYDARAAYATQQHDDARIRAAEVYQKKANAVNDIRMKIAGTNLNSAIKSYDGTKKARNRINKALKTYGKVTISSLSTRFKSAVLTAKTKVKKIWHKIASSPLYSSGTVTYKHMYVNDSADKKIRNYYNVK